MWHTFSTVLLFLETSKETEIGHLNDDPAYKASNSRNVHKPGEDHGSVVDNRQIHEGRQ